MKRTTISSFDGTKLACWTERRDNTRPTLIFLHGWPHNNTMWMGEIDLALKREFSVMTMDLRGFGMSDKSGSEASYDIEYYAKDVEAALDHFGIAEYILIGHSLGGMIALTLALKGADGLKAVAVCASAAKSPVPRTLRKFSYCLLKLAVSLAWSLTHTDVCVDFQKERNGMTVRLFFQGVKNATVPSVMGCFRSILEFNITDQLWCIAVPVLVLVGRKDILTPLRLSNQIAEGTPCSELVVLNGNHTSVICHAALVDRYLHDFLNKHGVIVSTARKGNLCDFC